MAWECEPLLNTLLHHERTPQLVAAFFDPNGPFEGDLLHSLPGNAPHEITIEDLFAITLLDVRVAPPGVRRLLYDSETKAQVHDLLSVLPTGVDIWHGQHWLRPEGEAHQLWRKLQREGDRVGPVTAAKLLCRKRPRLIPIIDEVVEGIIAVPSSLHWTLVQEIMQSDDRREVLISLRPSWISPEVSTLRLLDVTLWMWGSQARATKLVRRRLELPVDGWRAL